MQKDCVGQFESIGYKFCISSLVLNTSKHSASKIKTESQPCGICNNKKNVDAHFRNVNLELFCSHIQLLGTFLRDHADTKLKQNGQQYIIFSGILVSQQVATQEYLRQNINFEFIINSCIISRDSLYFVQKLVTNLTSLVTKHIIFRFLRESFFNVILVRRARQLRRTNSYCEKTTFQIRRHLNSNTGDQYGGRKDIGSFSNNSNSYNRLSLNLPALE